MDFMFEDDVDEVGSDVEAYCPKCKADTTHVVISKYEDEIRRVQCNPCGDVHSFRKPRGEAEEDMPEPVAARKRALLKKATWEEFFAKHGDKNAKPYEFRETYRENAIVFHPKFGKGYVSEVVSESKVEITFGDARRILVHNRKDIPGSPVGREDDGLPSTAPVPAPKANGKAAKTAEKAAAKGVPAKAAASVKAPPPKVEAKDAKKNEDKKNEDKKNEDKKHEDKRHEDKKGEGREPKESTKETKKAVVSAKPGAKKAAEPKNEAPKAAGKKAEPKRDSHDSKDGKKSAAKKAVAKKAPAKPAKKAAKPAKKKHK